MKLMKKLVSILFFLLLLCGAVACRNPEQPETPGTIREEDLQKEELTIMPTEIPEPTVEVKPTAAAKPTVEVKPTATAKPTASKSPQETLTQDINPAFIDRKIKEEAERLGFSFGTVISASTVNSSSYKKLVEGEFNSITAANEMKAYSLLDQKASQSNPEGMPVMNYTQADEIAAYAQSIGIGVRGHVLVWDAYMSDWFFREGYQNDGAYVDSETMKARLKYYIEEVITHFETRYPGVVYCWDVVNEAVGDSASEYMAGDVRHVRTMRSGGDNMFYKIIGDDYVELSFLYAKDTVDKLKAEKGSVSITLFYNDYNTFYNEKRDAICELVKSINTYARDEEGNYRILCEGIGMQSYIGGYGQQAGCMNTEDITRIKTAVKMYHELGLEVHVTEMAVRNYDEEQAEKHAEFCGKLFEAYAELNSGEVLISNISIWGICDNPWMMKSEYSYKMNSPYCGLFTRTYERKLAYYKALEALIGE